MTTSDISSQALRQSLEVFSPGTRAWFTDEQEAWISASVTSKTMQDGNIKITFQDDSDPSKVRNSTTSFEVEHVFESSISALEKNNGADLPPLRNPPKMENTDDLTTLSYLNEPAVLNTIKTRYQQRTIYTYSGIVLIAANPFDRVALYEPDIIQQYSGRRRGELEPHLFAIAEDAYRCMIREQTNQTIVVSGESGAGKTVSAKYIMRYFATADDKESSGKKKKADTGGMTEVEEQILATNPIMEAFGNAKTTRNDNSSRFGKYIEIQFDKGSNIIGAKIRTYLLERSRLIFQPETERNYHIFYQLCAGAPASERKEFELGDYNSFHYLNQSGIGVIPGVDDVAEFEITQRSLSTVGISVQVQWQIFRLLAALLHIGNVQITGRTDAALVDSDPALITATRLLGIEISEFRKWIIKKQIITRSEKIITNLTVAQALVVKDSVAKYIYANLFDWLVNVINQSLSAKDVEAISTFIGVLDIYGFEHFKKNSFEQFCINYANEKLQQEFNQHVFKLEQEEYIREEINWQFIEFSDNQKCIEMIEGKLGILSLLDEECRLPSGTDQGYCNKLYSTFEKPPYKDYFKKPRFSNAAFTVVHYAHDVQYESEGFLDKNKDTVPDEHLVLLQSSNFDFLVDILSVGHGDDHAQPGETNHKRMSMVKKPTLGSIFKHSLISLMDTIGQTNVHYIRCIKPNEAKIAWEFEPNMVLAQLRACGVLETIRISCAGYPSRWTFDEFAERYYALVSSKYWDPSVQPDVRRLTGVILDACIQDKDKYQVGKTKIFFRAGQLAYLEKLRADRWNDCAILIQKNIRRFIMRIRYLKMRDLAVRLQAVARKKVGQANLQYLREEKAAILVQKNWRRYIARKQYLKQRAFIIRLQTLALAYVARKRHAVVREHNAAIQIQRLARGWAARRKFKAQREHIVRIQTCFRRRQARKQLLALKAEARSVSHFKEVSYKLESKVVELTQTLTQQKEEKVVLQEKAAKLEQQVRAWVDRYDKLDKKAKDLETNLQAPKLDAEWDTLQQERDALHSNYQTSLDKIRHQDSEIARLTEELTKQKNEVAALRQTSQKMSKYIDEPDINELKSQISALKAQLSQTLNQPRRQNSLNSSARNLSPVSERSRGMSPGAYDRQENGFVPSSQRGRSPTGNAALYRRNSIADVKKNKVKTSLDRVSQVDVRATSIDQLGVREPTDDEFRGSPAEIIYAILHDEDALQEEILNGLIRDLKIPQANSQSPLSKKEVLFPAHAISICASHMWKLGYMQESEKMLYTVMDTIQKQCLSYAGDDAIIPCAFWYSNVQELLSLICKAEQDFEQEMNLNSMNGMRAVGWHEFEKLIATIKYEIQCLEDNIFHAWMTEMKRRLNKMAVPALIESQSLPGFVTSETGRFLNKIIGSSQPAFSMDDLLGHLNTVYHSMRRYYIENFVSQQVLIELLKLIGTVTFNDLVMRRNFSSWKRAMQIQYNITRLEEWCKSHEVPEGALQLEHLMQATKLLQLKKATLEDIHIIYDVCWMLTPTQIQKLITNYYVADYESPISHEIMRVVAAHVVSGDKNDILLLDSVSLDDTPFELPPEREVTPEAYLPSFLNLKRVQKLVALA
ncbi:hypothetical protein INT43_008806 [Umbelopsis isabellina]|uniref:Uncharacterized protein n=1 Tax=Mortierella isabellina TaxID=91625 RepID=A0A8H7UIN7_MORIS|nr:hypothetical protein INT43_008806 [Umbelopsis isabellina]